VRDAAVGILHARSSGCVILLLDMTSKPKLRFYDIRAKRAFETDQYEVVEKQAARGTMLFAVATSPYTGVKVYRLVGKKKVAP